MIIFCRVRIAYFFSRPFSLLTILLLSNQRELHTFRYCIQTHRGLRSYALAQKEEEAPSKRSRQEKLYWFAVKALLLRAQSTTASPSDH